MRGSWLVGIAAATGVLGGVIGALLIGLGQHSSKPVGSAGSAHDQDVVLCTSYALISANIRQPIQNGTDVLPAIAPLRLALTENPDANPQIRDAITQAIEGFDAILAIGAKPHGLSEPPAYDQPTVKAAFDRVSQVCDLDK